MCTCVCSTGFSLWFNLTSSSVWLLLPSSCVLLIFVAMFIQVAWDALGIWLTEATTETMGSLRRQVLQQLSELPAPPHRECYKTPVPSGVHLWHLWLEPNPRSSWKGGITGKRYLSSLLQCLHLFLSIFFPLRSLWCCDEVGTGRLASVPLRGIAAGGAAHQLLRKIACC